MIICIKTDSEVFSLGQCVCTLVLEIWQIHFSVIT